MNSGCSFGHTFVIVRHNGSLLASRIAHTGLLSSQGECGGAMQVSNCPTCNTPIGGTDHVLAAGNSRDLDMEELARQNHMI